MARKRRGRGEGCISQRPDGLWCAATTVGQNANGKRIRRWVYAKTKGEVQDKLARLQSSKLDGTLGDTTRLTVAKYLDQWLTTVAKPGVRPTTFANYNGAVKNHVNPRLGGVALTKITPAHVQGLYSAMQEAGHSEHVRRLTHAVLRRALKQAVKWGMVTRNVCDAVDPPRISEVEIRPLSTDQVAILLTTARGEAKTDKGQPIPADRLQSLYTLAVTTGMRMGEMFGLQWEDLDLDGESLCVRHTLVELHGMLTLSEPKTAKSRRKIELPRMAVQALHDHRKRMLVEGHAATSYVFCNQHGGPLRRSHFHRQDFKPLLKRAGLPPIRFHDLRHTAATLLFSEGVHPKVVQERLGHSRIGITMDTYSHCLPTMQRAAAGKIDKLLSGRKPKTKVAATA